MRISGVYVPAQCANVKSVQKVWNILKPYISGVTWKRGVLHSIPLQKVFFLLYNDTIFVTAVNFRAEILALGGGGTRVGVGSGS